MPDLAIKHERYLVSRIGLQYTSWHAFFTPWDGNQAHGTPDVKWSPLSIEICNTRGLEHAMPSQKQSWNVSCASNYTGIHDWRTHVSWRRKYMA